MTNFKAWIPPAGEVVAPPVHTETIVDVLFSDRSEGRDIAGNLNWSGEGDGPKIIAYSVIEEFVEKREPREWWLVGDIAFRSLWEARNVHIALPPGSPDPVHVREVLPEAPAKPAPREVVAWAVVDDKGSPTIFYGEGNAMNWQREEGGTVVKLSGYL